MKSGFYKQPVMTSSVVGLRRSSKAPKAKLVPRTGHGHCLLVCCQSDPLQLSESWQNHYIWEVCSANWWDALKTAMPAAGIVQQKGLILDYHAQPHVTKPMLLKLSELGTHPPYSPDLLPTDYYSFKHLDTFCRENTSTTSRVQKMLSKSLSNPEAQIFMLQE